MTKENDFDVIDEVFSQFKFNSHNLRTIMRLGEIWLVADDIWRALEYTNPRSVLSQLDDDQKSKAKIHTRGGPQSVCIINEPGLYNLMLRSRNSHARHFQKWITKWVLPALRENRQYETGKTEQFWRMQPNTNEICVRLPAPGQYHVTIAEDYSYLISTPIHDPAALLQKTAELYLLISSVIEIAALWLQNRLEYTPLTKGEYPYLHNLNLSIIKAKSLADDYVKTSKF